MCSEKASHRISVRGSPIRKSTDHGMCAPPRRLSQLTTSFFAYTRLGIHHVPFVACQKNLSIGKLQSHVTPTTNPSGSQWKPCPNLKHSNIQLSKSLARRLSPLGAFRPLPPTNRRRPCLPPPFGAGKTEDARVRRKTRETSGPEDRGGGEGTRTPDPLLAKQVLCQLSYTPTTVEGASSQCRSTQSAWWAWEDLNFRRHAYQAYALASWATGPRREPDDFTRLSVEAFRSADLFRYVCKDRCSMFQN